MRKTSVQLFEEAAADGWTFVTNAAPDVGQTVDVMHVFSRSYDCTGEIDASGRWNCANGFLLPNMTLTFEPTHWRPLRQGGAA